MMELINKKDIELICFENETGAFPKHYHETYNLSLIHSGLEIIELENKTVYSEINTISFTNPYEVHSNPSSSSNLTFDTIYLSKDLVEYLFQERNIFFKDHNITDQQLLHLFIRLKNTILNKNSREIENVLKEVPEIMLKNQIVGINSDQISPNHSLKKVAEYIDFNIDKKISLDDLSKISNLNRFTFAKSFRSAYGMSPINYVLMKKIFASKNLIKKNTDITHLAYDFNFADLSHFSKTFKRYIGISPKSYQVNLNA